MLILPYVCAEFHDKTGAVIHKIRPEDLRIVTEAPVAIRQDPLFEMMVCDGSLRVPETKSDLKKLENDPDAKAPVMKAQEPAEDIGSVAPAGEAPTTASGGNLVGAEVSRNKRSPQGGAAPIEAADEKKSGRKSAENK